MDDIDVDYVYNDVSDDDDDDDGGPMLDDDNGDDDSGEGGVVMPPEALFAVMRSIISAGSQSFKTSSSSSSKAVKTTTGSSARDHQYVIAAAATGDDNGAGNDLTTIRANVPGLGDDVCIDTVIRETEHLLYCEESPLVQRPQYHNNFGLLLVLVLDHIRKTWLQCSVTLTRNLVTVYDKRTEKPVGAGRRLQSYLKDLCRYEEPASSEATTSASGTKRNRTTQKNKTLSNTYEECVDFLLVKRNIRHVVSDSCRQLFKHVPESVELRKALLEYVHRRDDVELRECMRRPTESSHALACIRRMLYGFLLIYLRVPYLTNFMRALTCTGLMVNRSLSLMSPYVASMVLVNRQTSQSSSSPNDNWARIQPYFPSWLSKQFNVACEANSPEVLAAIAYIERLERRDRSMRTNLERIKAAAIAGGGGDNTAVAKKGDEVLVEHARAYHTLVLEFLGDREMSKVVDSLQFCTSNARFVQIRMCPMGSINAGVHQSETMFRNVTTLSLLNCPIQDEEAVFIARLEHLDALHIEDCNALCSEPIRSIHARYEQQLAEETEREQQEAAEDFDDDAFLSRVKSSSGSSDDDDDDDDDESLRTPLGYRPPRYLSLVDNQSMRVYLPYLWRDTLTHLVLDRTGIDRRSFDVSDVNQRIFTRLAYLSLIENAGVLNWTICRDLAVLVISQINGELASFFQARIDARDVCYVRTNSPFPLRLLEQIGDNSNRFERLHVFSSSIDQKALDLFVSEHEEYENVVHSYFSPRGDVTKMPYEVTGFYSIDMKTSAFYRLVSGLMGDRGA